MKNNLLATLLLLASVVVVLTVARREAHYRHAYYEAMEAAELRVDTLERYRDMAGSEHASRVVMEGSFATLSELYGRDMDSVARRLRIRERQLSALTTMGTRDTGRWLGTTEVIHDTVYWGRRFRDGYRFTAGDRFTAIAGMVDSTGADVEWELRDSLTVATYWRRRHLWSRRELVLDAYSMNPKCTVSGLQGLRIMEPKGSRYGFCVFGGMDAVGLRPVVGIGVYYSIFHF